MNRWTFPFSPDPYCKISVRGNEDWTWEKASKSLTVIVVNSSPVPGSFIYCKSLHLPEPLTSRGFYWGPLAASLMCATIYFNINILHMYRNIYSKRWETDCFRRPGGFFFFFSRWGLGELELSQWTTNSYRMHPMRADVSRATARTDPRRRFSLFHSCANPNSCPAAESPCKSFARRFTHGAGGARASEGGRIKHQWFADGE